MIPETVRTPRLILRPLRAEDWARARQYAGDSEAPRTMTWGPNDPAQTRSHIEAQADPERRQSGAYAYAVDLVETGELIGSCTLHAGDDGAGWIGCIFDPSFWGRGFATECAHTVLRLGFEGLKMARITAVCRPGNTASRRVLEKAGLRLEAHLPEHVLVRGRLEDSVRYALSSGEWFGQPRRAAVFDMDGVIADTEPLYYASNQSLFRDLGITVSPDDYAQFVGLDAVRMWARLKDAHRLPQPVPELVRMEIDGMVAALRTADLQPMPGLRDLLAGLKAKNVALALASSSSHSVIRIVLSRLSLEGTFSVVVSGEDVESGKPEPDIFLLASQSLGIPPAGCLVIEDAAHGVRAAAAAGMRCAALRNPSSGNQDLSSADLIVDTLTDIPLEW